MNIKTTSLEEQIAQLLRTIDQPARLRILMAIGHSEACVCHLEAMLELRQAYISQHLMALRQAAVLTTRREGRYVYYRLSDPHLLDLIQLAGSMTGVDENTMQTLIQSEPFPLCECPNCAAELQAAEGSS
jgi:ArsR family transcriptional regulator